MGSNLVFCQTSFDPYDGLERVAGEAATEILLFQSRTYTHANSKERGPLSCHPLETALLLDDKQGFATQASEILHNIRSTIIIQTIKDIP